MGGNKVTLFSIFCLLMYFFCHSCTCSSLTTYSHVGQQSSHFEFKDFIDQLIKFNLLYLYKSFKVNFKDKEGVCIMKTNLELVPQEKRQITEGLICDLKDKS